MVVEIVDEKSKIEAFQHQLTGLFDQANCGGLVTLETVQVVHYVPEGEVPIGSLESKA
jgi:PII-like signaling protein